MQPVKKEYTKCDRSTPTPTQDTPRSMPSRFNARTRSPHAAAMLPLFVSAMLTCKQAETGRDRVERPVINRLLCWP